MAKRPAINELQSVRGRKFARVAHRYRLGWVNSPGFLIGWILQSAPGVGAGGAFLGTPGARASESTPGLPDRRQALYALPPIPCIRSIGGFCSLAGVGGEGAATLRGVAYATLDLTEPPHVSIDGCIVPLSPGVTGTDGH